MGKTATTRDATTAQTPSMALGFYDPPNWNIEKNRIINFWSSSSPRGDPDLALFLLLRTVSGGDDGDDDELSALVLFQAVIFCQLTRGFTGAILNKHDGVPSLSVAFANQLLVFQCLQSVGYRVAG